MFEIHFKDLSNKKKQRDNKMQFLSAMRSPLYSIWDLTSHLPIINWRRHKPVSFWQMLKKLGCFKTQDDVDSIQEWHPCRSSWGPACTPHLGLVTVQWQWTIGKTWGRSPVSRSITFTAMPSQNNWYSSPTLFICGHLKAWYVCKWVKISDPDVSG